MRLQPHLAASAAAGGAVWAITGDTIALPVAIAAGVLPDADHLLDYYFKFIRHDRRFQFYLLHGWEYFIAGVIAYIFVTSEPWLLAAVAGYFTQLALDQASHARDSWPTAYFITPRILKRFRIQERQIVAPEDEYRSLLKSLPFGKGAVERWFQSRIDRGKKSRSG